MDEVTALVAQAGHELEAAHARLIAARRARWQGTESDAYRDRLTEAAARLTVLTDAVRASHAAAPWAPP
ncbi:hypothetical protein [Demequina iriomotensis]|uniref:hypothetical protein n=1 Tax=Demequina iriomotensis TaxID=1536641 RepID=UPI0007836955|nr:hypothetical protein [Demequina iriomotensis]